MIKSLRPVSALGLSIIVVVSGTVLAQQTPAAQPSAPAQSAASPAVQILATKNLGTCKVLGPGYHLLSSSSNTAVLTFTMGGGQRPDEDATNAKAACGQEGGKLVNWFQVATCNGGDH